MAILSRAETRTCLRATASTYVKTGERWLIVDHHSSAMRSSAKTVLSA